MSWNKKTKQRRIPLCPRANLSGMDKKAQAKLDAKLDAQFKETKRKYAAKYGQAALDEELKRYGY